VESAPAAPVTKTAPTATATPAAVAAAAVAAAPAAPAEVQETEEQKIERLVQAKIDEAFPQESDDERIARIVSVRFDAAQAAMIQSGQGQPQRKGVVRQVDESTALNKHGLPESWPDKPLHEFSRDEFDKHTGPVLVRHVLQDRAHKIA
jgi:hypothetical protein